MALFRRKKGQPEVRVGPEHAVITHLPLSDDEFGTPEEREAIHELEERIEEAVAEIGGEHDGDEFGGGEAVLFTYGPDADSLFAAVARCLEGFPIRPGTYAVKRHGRADDPRAREERIAFTSSE